MTKDELKALGLSDEQAAKVAEDYEKNYVEKEPLHRQGGRTQGGKG